MKKCICNLKQAQVYLSLVNQMCIITMSHIRLSFREGISSLHQHMIYQQLTVRQLNIFNSRPIRHHIIRARPWLARMRVVCIRPSRLGVYQFFGRHGSITIIRIVQLSPLYLAISRCRIMPCTIYAKQLTLLSGVLVCVYCHLVTIHII